MFLKIFFFQHPDIELGVGLKNRKVIENSMTNFPALNKSLESFGTKLFGQIKPNVYWNDGKRRGWRRRRHLSNMVEIVGVSCCQ